MMFKKNTKPFIIAEIGSNHNGNMKLCEKLIKKAKLAGADAVKFQYFSLNSLFSETYFKKNDLNKKDIKKFSLSFKNIKFICECAKKNKIKVGFTPLGFKEINILQKFKVDFYKIASMDCNNYELIEKVAKTKKPLIISTGLSNISEIKTALKSSLKYNKKVSLLHCVSIYPPKDEEVNLLRIKTLNMKFNIPIGFSDHCLGIDHALASILYGSCIIEKHFTLNKKFNGWDHSMSIDFGELKELVIKSKKIFKSIGSSKIYRVETKKQTNIFRRSIVAEKKIQKGEKISTLNISLKRPGNGLQPKFFKKILGKKAKKNIKKGSLLKLSDF